MIGARKLISSGLAFALVVFGSLFQTAIAQEVDLKPGQVWTYRDPALPLSRVIIGKVEEVGGAKVVSISITNVPIPNDVGPTQTIGHAPFQEKALRDSLISVEGETKIPDAFEDGYKIWKEASDAGRAGYLTLSVADAVSALAQTVKK